MQTHSDILSKKLDKVYLALTGNVCVCVQLLSEGFSVGLTRVATAHLSSVRPSSRLRKAKILALCSLFLSAESVAPIADTDTATHGEQEPAISMGSPGFTTTFMRWGKREEERRRERHQVCNCDDVTNNYQVVKSTVRSAPM